MKLRHVDWCLYPLVPTFPVVKVAWQFRSLFLVYLLAWVHKPSPSSALRLPFVCPSSALRLLFVCPSCPSSDIRLPCLPCLPHIYAALQSKYQSNKGLLRSGLSFFICLQILLMSWRVRTEGGDKPKTSGFLLGTPFELT